MSTGQHIIMTNGNYKGHTGIILTSHESGLSGIVQLTTGLCITAIDQCVKEVCDNT